MKQRSIPRVKMKTKKLLNIAVLLGFLLSIGVSSAEKVTLNAKPDTLRVLVWNVWHGTNDVDNGPEKALQLIKESKADICLLQESYDIEGARPQFGPWAAQELGWNVWQGKSPHLCVVSRYKIKKTFFHASWHGLGVELEDDKGRTLHAFSIWLDWKNSAPSLLLEKPNCTDEDLLACEKKHSGRFQQAKDILAYLERMSLTSIQTPLLVGGDWNCPSHLDWTQATSEAFQYRRPLPLPVSKEMEANGFQDTYRVVRPDPVKYPGNTWSPLFRTEKGVALPMNRIDRLYYRSNREAPLLKAVRAIVYPETLEDDSIPARQRLFPSDHAALLVEFEWHEPAVKSSQSSKGIKKSNQELEPTASAAAQP